MVDRHNRCLSLQLPIIMNSLRLRHDSGSGFITSSKQLGFRFIWSETKVAVKTCSRVAKMFLCSVQWISSWNFVLPTAGSEKIQVVLAKTLLLLLLLVWLVKVMRHQPCKGTILRKPQPDLNNYNILTIKGQAQCFNQYIPTSKLQPMFLARCKKHHLQLFLATT